jgi:hypothetical protein
MVNRTAGRADLKGMIVEILQELAQSGSIGATRASSSPGGQWVEDILDALKPLQALSPGHGEVPKHEAPRIISIQNALRRADLSKAVRPANPTTAFYRICIHATGSKK